MKQNSQKQRFLFRWLFALIIGYLFSFGLFLQGQKTAINPKITSPKSINKAQDIATLETDSLKNKKEISTFEGGIGLGNVEYEEMMFFYHTDPLGNTSYITDINGRVVQHIEYMPYGEVFIEERDNSWSTPYLFNAKELDQESGLYYFGARYYDPKLGMFLSVDPLLNKTMDPYGFGNRNPIRFMDPWGMAAQRGAQETICIPCITAAAGGLIGGGIEIASQFYNRGSIDDWGAVAGSAMQGTITGAAAAFTAGASLLATTAVSAGANVAGGVANRSIQSRGTNFANIATDATIGAAFGAGGKVISQGVSKLTSQATNQATAQLKGVAVAQVNVAGKGGITGLSKIISIQKQARHIAGTAKSGGGFLNSVDDAQSVLNAVHSGKATFLGTSKAGHQVYRFNGVTGTNVNLGADITGQPTNVFMIKGTTSPSVVPTSPLWKP